MQTEIASFIDRSDLPVTTLIQLAEATFNAELRHWRMETNAAFSSADRFTTLPSDWRETIRLDVSGGDRLQLVAHPEIQEMRARAEDTTGEPRVYAFVAGQIEVFPTPDTTYTFNHLYYADFPNLSDSNTTNWLLSYAPDVYLYGSLLHSAPYLVEDERLPVWAALHKSGLERVQRESDRARHSGTKRVKVR